MRRYCLLVTACALTMVVDLPALAQDGPWSVGLGISRGEASPENTIDLEIEAFTAFGRWQHADKGWGAMLELRSGEDDEPFIEFDYDQINAYATYTWRRGELARPFVKFGASNTEVDFQGGAADDDTALIVGGGVEVGRGRWAFHASVDVTEPEIGIIDTETSNVTLGATFRF